MLLLCLLYDSKLHQVRLHAIHSSCFLVYARTLKHTQTIIRSHTEQWPCVDSAPIETFWRSIPCMTFIQTVWNVCVLLLLSHFIVAALCEGCFYRHFLLYSRIVKFDEAIWCFYVFFSLDVNERVQASKWVSEWVATTDGVKHVYTVYAITREFHSVVRGSFPRMADMRNTLGQCAVYAYTYTHTHTHILLKRIVYLCLFQNTDFYNNTAHSRRSHIVRL